MNSGDQETAKYGEVRTGHLLGSARADSHRIVSVSQVLICIQHCFHRAKEKRPE